jgi:hypothetical protein
VHRAFAANLEGLVEGMNDTDADTRKAFLEMFEIICKKDENPILNVQHSVTIINHVSATLTASGLSRRLDATKVVEYLSATNSKKEVQRAASKLVPLYSDICRGVLGTTSSSLVKGNSSNGLSAVQKSGKILQTLKRETELAKMSVKQKKMKAADTATTAELSLVAERISSAAHACRHLLSLDGFENCLNDEHAQDMILAVLELFLHSKEGKHREACAMAAEALSSVVSKCSTVLTVAIAKDIKSAFQGVKDLEVRPFSSLCCIACRGFNRSIDENDLWLEDTVLWFTTSREPINSELTVKLLEALEDDKARTTSVLEAFGETLKNSLINVSQTDGKEACQKLNTFLLLIPKLSTHVRHEWVRQIPSSLWTFGGGGRPLELALTSEAISEEESTLIATGLRIIRACASLEPINANQGDERFWTDTARSLSPLYCAFPKGALGAIFGPFVRLKQDIRDQLVWTIHSLPITSLPVVMIKSWSEVARRAIATDKDVILLVETVVWFMLRSSNFSEFTEMGLSFLATVALFSPSTQAVGVCCQAIKHIVAETGWPVGRLLSPLLVQYKDNIPNTTVWLEIASCTLSTLSPEQLLLPGNSFETNSSEYNLLLGVSKMLAMTWAKGSLGSKNVYTFLTNRVSPENIYLNAEEHDKDQVLSGWVELLVDSQSGKTHHELQKAWWGWSGNPQLHKRVNEIAKTNKKVESNLKLLQ